MKPMTLMAAVTLMAYTQLATQIIYSSHFNWMNQVTKVKGEISPTKLIIEVVIELIHMRIRFPSVINLMNSMAPPPLPPFHGRVSTDFLKS